MNSGVNATWSPSDRVEHKAGIRTLPHPRRMLSKVPMVSVISKPPNKTRANCVA